MFKFGQDVPTQETIRNALNNVFSREDRPQSTYPVTNSTGAVTHIEFHALLTQAASSLEEALNAQVATDLETDNTVDVSTLTPRIMMHRDEPWNYSDDQDKRTEAHGQLP